ncbi:MAG: response regulator transcription factor [Anaerolineae bacterium]|nr:response regulator transcription factor [Anaerolineae bacterium]
MTTLLLVEDSTELAQAIIRAFESAGYCVYHAADGEAALDLHARRQPDIMILDWMLPKLDGLAVLRTLRETSVTPVLMLTARGDEVDRVIGLEVGADDYLTKPFSMRELVARVRAMLRRVEYIAQTMQADRDHAEQPVAHGALRLDPASHQATLGGEPLDLSRTEFALLDLLLRNPGRAFSRAYLMETVWEEAYMSSDRSVDNAMARLRKKLGDWGEMIETVWGVGYRLRAQ